jgi:hypothetical protein
MNEMKNAISLFLVLSILLLSGNTFAKDREGADVIIQKKDESQIRGELIAVKEDSLFLIDRELGTDVSADIGDIQVIKIVRRSRALVGGIAGLSLGGVIGFLIGYPKGKKSGFVYRKPEAGGIGAAIGGGLCALVGVGIGAAVGADKTIKFEGKSDAEIQEILDKLRKKARVKNYQ